MKVSTRARYGVRLMFELALGYGNGLQLLKEIARKQEISEKYLSQIIIPLKAKGFVRSGRGMRGGYMLAQDPQQITVAEIVEALEGNFDIVECVDRPSVCRRASLCVARDIWVTLKEKMYDTLRSITLQDLVDMYREKKEGVMMYNI
ncbi:MAG: RrF2 family transcriptional regulator [Candidatus Omnitrophota bacterium]|nr:MAG: RrF2 family transcriptional regulator [Candidatus Omnitrophota bacterium]